MSVAITTGLIGIIAALVGAWAGAAISRRSAIDILKKEQFLAAASKFKSLVIYELTGLYPINLGWDKDNFHRLYDSIPVVNSAAAEFKYFVASKIEFDKAVGEYNKYCRETTYDSVQADTMYSGMRQQGEISKREHFRKVVERLLYFADKF